MNEYVRVGYGVRKVQSVFPINRVYLKRCEQNDTSARGERPHRVVTLSHVTATLNSVQSHLPIPNPLPLVGFLSCYEESAFRSGEKSDIFN